MTLLYTIYLNEFVENIYTFEKTLFIQYTTSLLDIYEINDGEDPKLLNTVDLKIKFTSVSNNFKIIVSNIDKFIYIMYNYNLDYKIVLFNTITEEYNIIKEHSFGIDLILYIPTPVLLW